MLNTVFDTYVSVTFFLKTVLDPLVAKNGSKEVNNMKFTHAIETFKIGLVYFQKNWLSDFLYNLCATSLLNI